MKLPSFSFASFFCLYLAFSGLLVAEAPPLLTTGVEIGSSNERTALNRTTRKLSSTVDVKIKNTSDRLLEAPLHAVISFTPLNGGNLAALTMPGALGGVGVEPYQTFYKDLSASIGNGLAVGGETTFSFTFERPEGTTVSYAVAIRGIRNNDPNGLIGGPYSGQLGSPLPFDASNSTDPDGEALTFSWDFGDGSTGTGAKPQHAYSTTGLFSVVVTVSDPRGAVVTRETQVPISPPGAFALARTRTLDGNGHPLGTVAVTQSGPDGSRTFQSDTVSGFTSLGGQPGDHTWSFAREGYLTSFRKTTLNQGAVKVVSFPWLAPLNASRTTLSLLNPTSIKSPAERVTLTLPPEAFEQVVSVALTDLHGQNLPLPLPFGWSPLAAFHLDAPATSAADIVASVKLLQAVPLSRPLVLVHLTTATPAWLAESLHTSTGGDTLALVLRKPGSYAVVIADTLPTGNPALAEAGQPLPAGTAAVVAPEVTAAGVVNPAATVASLDPARVTATATVDFTNGTQPLASGAWFLADVEETYDLRDGQAFKTPDYDATFYAYQTPGDTSASTATASFPLRPRILFGPDQLTEANLKVDVVALNQFSGGIVTQDGGLLSLPGLRIGIPAGVVAGPSAAEIRLLSTANLSRFLGEFQPLLAFEINLPPLANGTALDFSITQKLAPDSHFVLARCVGSGSESGLQPVLRLRSDAQGGVTSNEPASGLRLPGITGSGQFVIVKIAEPEALITGLVRKVGGAPLPGAQVRVGGEPWLSLTGGAGTFFTLAKPGERSVIGSDPMDGNSGEAVASLADAAATANVEIQTALTSPRVVAITPADGAVKVKPTTPIIVQFSEPLDLASFGPEAITVTNPLGVRVTGALTLNLAATEASFLPTNPLEHAATFTVELAATIRDRQGLEIVGNRSFNFSVIPFFERPVGAQLVIYEPGADNIPQAVLSLLVGYSSAQGSSHVVAHGSPGTADPEVPVILVNQNTGATATVLSKPDGSFANFIDAAEEDFIEAVFVNANGTRVTVPATRQLYDNGKIGLYKYGGILEAESDGGPVQVLIEPQAIKERTVFKLDLFTVNQLAEMMGGVLPEGEAQALPGIQLSYEGDRPEGDTELSMPVDTASLGLEPGVDPETAAFVLTLPVRVGDEVVYMTVDKMRFENGRLFTNTCPFPGAFSASAVENMITVGSNFLTPLSAITTGFAQIAIPILVSRKTGGIVVNGRALQITNKDLAKITAAQAIELALLPFSFSGGSFFAAGLDTLRTSAQLVEELRTKGARPVQGALVALRAKDENFDGTIRPGLVCALSDQFGCFSMMIPLGAAGKLVGTHPRAGRASDVPVDVSALLDIGTKGFLLRNIFFTPQDDELFSNLRPRVVVSHSPLDPAVGSPVSVSVDVFCSAPGTPSILLDREKSLVRGILPGQEIAEDLGNLEIQEGAIENVAPGHLRRIYVLTADAGLHAVLQFKSGIVVDERAVFGNAFHSISFGFARPVITNPLVQSDPNDSIAPSVVAVSPREGDFLYPGEKVVVRFSEPIDRALLDTPGAVIVSGRQGVPAMTLSPDQQELTFFPRLINPGVEVRVTLGTAIRDLAGNAMRVSRTLGFRAGQPSVSTLPGMEAGGGSVVDGSLAYVMERGGQTGVKVFDLSDPSRPALEHHITRLAEPSALDFPRDAVVIRDWSHFTGFDGEKFTGVSGRPLLCVSGGLLGSSDAISGAAGDLGNVLQQGQYLTIFDITNPRAPVLVTNVLITARPSVITKMQWRAPFLAYLENSADTHFVSIVDVQAHLVGFATAPDKRLPLFGPGRIGLDLNGDGDYTDAGDVPPKPKVRDQSEFMGFLRGYDVTPFPAQRIEDFDFDGLENLAVVRNRNGVSQEPGLTLARPEFRILVANRNELPTQSGVVKFGNTARLRRLSMVPGVRLVDGRLRNLAFVTVSPDVDGKAKVVVIDWTNTLVPEIVVGIEVPPELEIGLPQSPQIGPDGLVRVATTTGQFLIDPAKVYLPPGGDPLHPAVVGVVGSGGSSNFSIGTNESGLRVIALGGRTEVVQEQPKMEFVHFPISAAVVDPRQLRVMAAAERKVVIDGLRPLGSLRPARSAAMAGVGSTLSPPSPQTHYHVLLRAPGGGGVTVPLLLESVNEAGAPLNSKGKDYPPVRAAQSAGIFKPGGAVVEGVDAPVGSITAYRLSDDPTDPRFNMYLSEPIAVIREKITSAQLKALNTEIPRVVLWSEAGVRAGIDHGASGILATFQAEFDSIQGEYVPRVHVTASTLPGGYVPGGTPPPVGGGMAVPGTFGTIEALSGEFRHTTEDLALPSRVMPIIFERTATNHALAHSGFGRGWDFNYNQRAIELKPQKVPAGEEVPVVDRGGAGKDSKAASLDIIFGDGQGNVIVFKNQGKTAPPGVANDPLMAALGWNTAGGEFYLPASTEKGVFDLMYRFPAGEKARVTPDGRIFRYNDDGRLIKIEHRYPDNFHELDYNSVGQLVRIADRSVSDGRDLRIGYFRKAGEATFNAAVDKISGNDKHSGRICSLVDFAGRRVDFEYDEVGMLVRRLGVEVAGANAGFAGRQHTTYQIQAGTRAYIGVIAGNGANGGGVGGNAGTPLAVAQASPNGRDEPVATATTGAGGPVGVQIPANRSAASVGSGSTQIQHADGSSAAVGFDSNGYPASIVHTGAGAGAATQQTIHNERGLPQMIIFPEGNSIAYEYEPDSAPFRARGNVVKAIRDPGARGGAILTSEAKYDHRYNLPAGDQRNENGQVVTVTLRSDGRDVQAMDYPKSGTHVFTHNAFGQVTGETTLEGIVTTLEYNTAGYLRSEVLGGELVSEYQYDGSVAAKLGMPTGITPPLGSGISMDYDARLKRTGMRRGDQDERRGYDENDNVVFISRATGDGAAYEEVREYSQVSFLSQRTVRGVETGGSARDLVTRFTPDALFRVKEIRLPEGEVRELGYDHLGYVRRMKLGAYQEDYGRDLHGNLLSVRMGGEEVKTAVYDGHDRAITIRHKTGTGDEVTEMDYFGAGQMRSRKVSGPVGGVVAESVVNEVDELGRPMSVEIKSDQVNAQVTINHRGDGGRTVTTTGPVDTSSLTYDGAGRIVRKTDSLHNVAFTTDGNGNLTKLESEEDGVTYTLEKSFNALDQMIREFDPVGTLAEHGALRLDGLPLTTTDGRGNTINRAYSRLGEVLRVEKPEQIRFGYGFTANRQAAGVSDRSGGGHGKAYGDGTLRVTGSTARDGSTTSFKSPDGRNLPTSVIIPGGSITMGYDLQGRVTAANTTFSGVDYRMENVRYDALGRLRSADYGSGGEHGVTMAYDKLGPLTGATYNEPGGPHVVSATIRADGTRTSLTYPSGVTVSETRQASGRLSGVSVGGGVIWRATAFAGADQPSTVSRGGNISESCVYDARRRLLARRFTGPGGVMLEDMRFQYDGADNLTGRQSLQGGGRADFFSYDAANRLIRADYGLRPVFQGGERGNPAGLFSLNGFAPGLFARIHGYDAGGLDLLQGSVSVNPDGLPAQAAGASTIALPGYAESIGGHDGFLFPRTVDGFSRGGPDALGNTARSRVLARPVAGSPVAVAADFSYNAHSDLVRVVRGDGVRVDCQYRPDKLMHHRKVTGGATAGERALVWHEGRLLEEYDLSPTKTLVARYYYANDDPPVAADLRQGDGSMLRVHYLWDNVLSVVAVANEAGEVLERVRYDAWGQAVISGRDQSPPQVAEVRRDGDDLMVVMSEPVLPPLVVPPLVLPADSALEPANANAPARAFRLIVGGNEQSPQVVFEENSPGLPFGCVFRITPAGALSGNVILRVLPGTLVDGWNNPAAGEDISFPFAVGPLQVSRVPAGSTASAAIPRSAIGNPWLWQGQWFDYDAGLVYMRARHYDPMTGQFLQRDPEEYEDSVNLYAAMANNPLSHRDPSGRQKQRQANTPAGPNISMSSRKFLYSRGLTDMEVDSIINVLSRRGEKIKLSIRSFGDKAKPRRMQAEMGTPNKPAHQKAKNNEKALGRVKTSTGKYEVTSDLDVLHISINGQMANHQESMKLLGDINREYSRLFHQAFDGTGMKVNPPFQHGAHTGMVHLYGNKFVGTKVDDNYLAKVGHPGDSFTLDFSESRKGIDAFDTPRAQNHADILEAESVLKQKQLEMGLKPTGFPGFRSTDGTLSGGLKELQKKWWMSHGIE